MCATPAEREPVRVLVVDDESPARSRLAALAHDIGVLRLVGEAASGPEALEAAARERPDIVLLDIRMPGMDGIEVARHLARMEMPPAVIFTTAYDSHALAAFEANAVDYLLKPIRLARLSAAVERAQQLTRAQLARLESSRLGGERTRTHISATLYGQLQLVPVDEVRYFRAEDKYVAVRHPAGQVLVEDSLSSLEHEFGERLLRVHRNALVALAHVLALERAPGGGWQVRLDGVAEPVAVSRRLVSKVRKTLKERK